MRDWARLAVATVLIVTAIGGFILSGSGSQPRLIGGNLPLDAAATDPLDIAAHNSPTLVRSPADPSRLAVVNRIDLPRYSCALHLSDDGGRTWRRVDLPFPDGEESPPRCFAPDASFGADGRLYVSFVTLTGPGNVPSGLWLSAFEADGTSLAPPSRVWGPMAFQPRLVADTERPGHLFLTWLQASETANFAFPRPGAPILMAHSEDGGRRWIGPVEVTPPTRQRVVAPTMVKGRGDDLHVLYLDVGDDSLDYHGAHEGKGGPPYPRPWTLVLASSSDLGATWSETVVDEVQPTSRFIVFIPPTPALAIDRDDGRVYAAYHDGRLGDADVWVWSAEDDGAFGPAVRVNDTAVADGTSQYLPTLDVAPQGRLDVVYYDRRGDPDDVRNEVSFQSSDDGGASFGPRLPLSDRAFDSNIGFGSERGLPDLGSRLGLVSSTSRAFAVWTDTRAGTEASGKQVLAAAVVDMSGRSGVLAWGSGTALALGLAALAWWWRNRREQPSATC